MAVINRDYTDKEIRNIDQKMYKSIIKEKVRDNAFIHFKEMQANQEKGNILPYITPKNI